MPSAAPPTPPTPQPRDPYLSWAQDTGFSGHAAFAKPAASSRSGAPQLPLLIKLPLESSPQALSCRAGIQLPPAYLDPALNSRFCCAWVERAALNGLNAAVAEAALSLPLPGQCLAAAEHRLPEREDMADAPLVIGVIDKHCALLHRAYRRAWQGEGAAQSRLVGLWEQGRRSEGQAGSPWHCPADFGYGRALGRAAIAALLPGLDSAEDEAAAYRRLGYPLDAQGQLQPMLHGHQVLDIAGGLAREQALPASAVPMRSGDRADPVEQAELLFVDVPEPGPEDSSGAAADAYILDGIHYILRRAGPRARVLINISIGALAGPHDGHSLLEEAMDELLLSHPQLAITVAAGNAAQEPWHARGQLDPQMQKAGLHWHTIPGDATDSFMELWFFAEDPQSFSSLRLRLQSPSGQVLEAGLGEDRLLPGTPERPLAGLYFQLAGAGRAQALLALAPCSGERAGECAGVWQLEISRSSDDSKRPLRLAAWLQRDTPGRSSRPLLQSFITGCSGGLSLDGGSALSSLASGRYTVVVGAARALDGSRSAYSPSAGISAYGAADESAAIYGLLCAGALSGSWARLSGTSAATPVVARALAPLLLASPIPAMSSQARSMEGGGGSNHSQVGRPAEPGLWRLAAGLLGASFAGDTEENKAHRVVLPASSGSAEPARLANELARARQQASLSTRTAHPRGGS
ncbi:hypothetical protein [Paucibacter sp. DJ2R-2]|uniref:hypothetical protein n=1 Tax=Paucibacter sp. DJ2R-2 TaxID=2893558 RepID=UPI0021E412AA|nr:hypothetical protein [Paucibacter sp. DJ2R-2]MCV2419885.1 hypothetical protein [Paucibacter sp. DJ4R-1]MCV2437212.1 hypothetical protein [Paucibacter sp. DJ2R-2]